MSNEGPKANLAELYDQMMKIRQDMLELQTNIEPEPVDDYELATLDGKRSLSSYFNDKDVLFVIHNMGQSCVYCTVWADGFNGVFDHISDQAGLVITSPDSPEDQKTFADGRGWRIPMASTAGSSLASDLGYELDNGDLMPGTSVLKKESDGSLARVSHTPFGPGDAYCPVFNLFDLIPGTDSLNWMPKFSY